MADAFDWVDKQEEARNKDYFDIKEGKQVFVLLSHFAPFAQVFENGKYRPAEEGEQGASVKGVCWVLQDDVIKSAKMPYTIVKAVRELRDNPEWEFEFPFPHLLQLSAVGAGTKEVKYSLTPSPRKFEITQEVKDELAKKPTPEELVEKLKGGVSPSKSGDKGFEYPAEEINPEDIPFD